MAAVELLAALARWTRMKLDWDDMLDLLTLVVLGATALACAAGVVAAAVYLITLGVPALFGGVLILLVLASTILVLITDLDLR